MPRPNARLKSLREQIPLTQAELAEQVGVAEMSVRRWEAGLRPQPVHIRRLCAVFNASPAELGYGRTCDLIPAGDGLDAHLGELPDPRLHPGEEDMNRRDFLQAVTLAPEILRRVLRTAGAEAMEFTRETGVSGVGTGTLDHLESIITDLDQSYPKVPPADQFAVARAYRIRVQTLIQGPHTFREGRQLYVYAAWLDEALAWLSHDLGDPLTAEAYAIDCFERADQAGHNELCAWATDSMASIAMYANRPERAATAARRGIGKAPASHPLAVRLRAQAARAHARLGQRDECERLLSEAKDLFDALPPRTPMRFTVDTGPLAAYAMYGYPASCSIWLGDFQQARRYAEQAVAVHETTSPEFRCPAARQLSTSTWVSRWQGWARPTRRSATAASRWSRHASSTRCDPAPGTWTSRSPPGTRGWPPSRSFTSSTGNWSEPRHERPARRDMNPKKPYFRLIAEGTKTVEVRVGPT